MNSDNEIKIPANEEQINTSEDKKVPIDKKVEEIINFQQLLNEHLKKNE